MSRYSVKIDWLSLVFPIVPAGEGMEEPHISSVIQRALHNEIGEGLADALFAGIQPLDYGRAPYSSGWQDLAHGITVWGGGNLPHFTVEFSGRGMDYLRQYEGELALLEIGVERCSRIDVAIDLDQGVQPEELLKYRKGGRQQTFSQMQSTGGNTCYVGSRHSERYVRVYRYASPHPRSHLLRIEAVSRRSYAKQVCDAVIMAGLEPTAARLMEDFGFGGIIFGNEVVPVEELTVYRPERNGGKTLRWLIAQVAPAFKRLVEDGTIPDAESFLWTYFMPEDTGEKGIW